MAQENIPSSSPIDPLPATTEAQKVTQGENGGWKAVIKGPEDHRTCDSDFQFSPQGAGVNEQRRRVLHQEQKSTGKS